MKNFNKEKLFPRQFSNEFKGNRSTKPKMAVKLFTIVLAALALAAVQAQTDVPPAAPSFEDQVNQHVAKTEAVVNVLLAKSPAPADLKAAVLSNAQQELAACVEQASPEQNRGLFYACAGTVISNAANALGAWTSSGASPVN